MVGQLLAQVHGHLARTCDAPGVAARVQVTCSQAVVVGHALLDVLDGNETVAALERVSKNAPGQVEVMVQGRLRVVQALTRSETGLPNRKRVKVVDVVDQTTLLVEPLEPGSAEPPRES